MTEHAFRQSIELFHLIFLDQLGRKLDKRFYALKGGANLRFFLHSIRYSEDMDIDVSDIPQHKLEVVVNGIMNSAPFRQILQVRGLDISRVSQPKQTDTTQRWKIGITLGTNSTELPTKIEFSRRGMHGSTVFEPIDPGLIMEYRLSPILVSHYDAKSAFSQKVHALADRSVTQARDIFDLHLLIASGADTSGIDPEIKALLKQAQTNAMEMDFTVFKSQVLSFLSPDHRRQYDSQSVWDDILLRVAEALQKGSL